MKTHILPLYYQGLLFILVRRPYEIGDGIAISDPNAETSIHGSGWWLVKDVSLFTTTVVYVMTNELATLSNGSMANSRIINATRSPHATLFTLVKFPIDVKYVKLAIFKDAIEQFIRNRPREWTSMLAFRATRAEASEGTIVSRLSVYFWNFFSHLVYQPFRVTGFVEYAIVSYLFVI